LPTAGSCRGLDPERPPYLGANQQFGGLHPGGVNVAFADGTVRFLKESIHPQTLEAFATMAGGEDVGNFLNDL
jgi:prepilin-type processing-associated H-X9-DG protein